MDRIKSSDCKHRRIFDPNHNWSHINKQAIIRTTTVAGGQVTIGNSLFIIIVA